MRITIIQGSPRDQANTAKVARFFEEQLAQKDAVSAVRFLDIRSFDFPNWEWARRLKRIWRCFNRA